MRRKMVVLMFFAVLCLFDATHTAALQTYQNGIALPCGSSGTLFTNLGPGPINFEMGADWSASCGLSMTWTDATGQAQTITLVTASFPSLGSSPSAGASSSLGFGGVISWSTAPSAGGGLLNLQLERAVELGIPRGRATERHANGTAGSVGGKIGAFPIGFNGGENVLCGTSGTLYTNLTADAVAFDLMLNNQSQLDFGNSSQTCNVTMSWTDRSGNAQTLTTSAGLSQGALATSLPAGGAISWASSGAGQSQVAFTWQLQREVSIRLREAEEEKGGGDYPDRHR